MNPEDVDAIGSARGNTMTAALARAPWWATLLVYFGLPSSMGLLAFLVFLGLIPSPYMLDKCSAIETHLAANRTAMDRIVREQETLSTELVATMREQVEQLRHLRTCVRHTNWKSCDD